MDYPIIKKRKTDSLVVEFTDNNLGRVLFAGDSKYRDGDTVEINILKAYDLWEDFPMSDILINHGLKVEDIFPEENNVRDYNIGSSDYSSKTIQPWDIWFEYNLNPWDADIVKRVLRTKKVNGQSEDDTRAEDYEKIIHICQERLSHFKHGMDTYRVKL